ncbi:hypothetical protein D9M68_677060 [compost metagenome]
MGALDQAPRLAVVGQRVGHGAAEAVDHFAHGVVGEAAAVVDVEDGEHAAPADRIAQGVHHANRRFGFANGDAEDAPGGDVYDGGGLGAVGLAGTRVDDLGVELVAVGGEDVAGRQALGCAALKGLQGFQFLRAAPSTLASFGAQFVQEAAHLVNAGPVA